ncbi:kinesin-like protein KIF19 isoform X1 [Scyliorhinus canicula]|uniref:kinesin-like protein KIF19 isoform X1 n=2 Tax=Scyliorhinus canicula TaxID=7830 RepID=UPI0018F428E8|nr:kinesin-like protein KIF19 isoform X1 [Scyliorhinus canicula]
MEIVGGAIFAVMKELAGESRICHQLTVALRIRPINELELDEGASIIAHKVDDQMVVLMDPTEDPDDILRANRSRERTFMFDVVFDPTSTQEDVYMTTTKDLINGVISGYNATVFAYGPTGAGKTYTMLGMDCKPGIYVQTLNDLFKAIDATSENMDYNVSMSYLEIYNEMIRDLLNPSSGFLDLREDSKGGIQIPGITEFSTCNAMEIVQLLTKGNRQRTQEPTAANKTSSRSHAVLQVTVKQKSRLKNITEEIRVGRLFLIDLAGSERASQTQNTGKRMKEGAHINRSLLALGNCINALSEKGANRSQYVNYRDSKLTRLLKDSLGGNSRTVMIAHISPASASFEESRNTLMYADRAKNIKTRVKRNLLNISYHITQYTNIIADLRKEIERLKLKIDEQGPERRKSEKANIRDIQAEVQQHSVQYNRGEMDRLKDQLMIAFRQQMEIHRSLVELENTNMELHIDTSRHLLTIADWEREKAKRDRKWWEEKWSEKTDKEQDDEERESGMTDELDMSEPLEVSVAREELGMLLTEQRKTAALKCELEQKLGDTKAKVSKMEDLLPKWLNNKDQQEIMSLLCKVHELEVENTEIQSTLLHKENILQQKDFVIQHYEQHRALCDEIILQQRQLIDDHNIQIPQQLHSLYTMYWQEMEEGTLDSLITLHTITSSTLRDRNLLNVARQLNLEDYVLALEGNKEDMRPRTVHENRKLLHARVKDSLPPILPDHDSDTNKVFKATAQSRYMKPLPTLTPPPIRLAGPLLLQKQSLINLKERSRSRQSNTPSEAGSSKSEFYTVNRQQSPGKLQEIVTGTKSISVIAAKRRSRANVADSALASMREKERNIPSTHSVEENEGSQGQADAKKNTLNIEMKSAVNLDNLAADLGVNAFRNKQEFNSSPPLSPRESYTKMKGLKKAEQREDSTERNARKKPSRSFEVNSQGLPKLRPNPSRPHNLKSISDHRFSVAPRLFQNSNLNLQPKVMPASIANLPSANVPPASKIKFPLSYHSGESQLQKIEVGNTTPSTIHQRNADGSKGLILHKRVRGPSDGSNTQQLRAHVGNFKKGNNLALRTQRMTGANPHIRADGKYKK